MVEQLNYYSIGDGEKHVLLLHGLAADSGFWLPLISQIDKSLHTLHLVDLKGHGKSSFNDTDMSPSRLADEVALLMESKGFAPSTLICHSFGGRVGLNLLLALENNLPPLSLILLDTFWPEYQARPRMRDIPGIFNVDHLGDDLSTHEDAPITPSTVLRILQARQAKNLGKNKSRRLANLATWKSIIASKELSMRVDVQIEQSIDLESVKRLSPRISMVYGSDSSFHESGLRASHELGISLTTISNARHFFPHRQADQLFEIIDSLIV